MYCENCGKKLNEGADVCLNCGKKVRKEEEPKANNQGFPVQNIPMQYQPISMWGYFGYEILFAIPCIGWICLIVFALGGTSNVNLKNFARSYFCFLILAVILGLIGFLLVGGITAANTSFLLS